MTAARPVPPAPTRLVDVVFPGGTNHHGTLFGGVGLAHMDKVAYVAAARHARVDFVTASCERIDFEAPVHLGDIVELTGRVVQVGRRSLAAAVEMVAEAPLTGLRRRCGRGVFNMVAVGGAGGGLPPLAPAPPDADDGTLRMIEPVFPERTGPDGSLDGGSALAAMAKAAFVAATRHCRKPVVMAATLRVDFEGPIRQGEVMELIPRVAGTGRTSLRVDVALWAEDLRSGERRRCGFGRFAMVAVDAGRRPTAIGGEPATCGADLPAGNRRTARPPAAAPARPQLAELTMTSSPKRPLRGSGL